MRAAAAYSKQHGRGQLRDWTRCNVNHAESITWSISVLNIINKLQNGLYSLLGYRHVADVVIVPALFVLVLQSPSESGITSR